MKRKTTIATVECDTDAATKKVAFAVESKRTITLRFPEAVYAGGYGVTAGKYVDFVRTLNPEEAREIGKSLIAAADAVEAEAR